MIVVMRQTGYLDGDRFQDIIEETSHDREGFVGNTSVWMNLFLHFENVDGLAVLTLIFL